MDRRDKEYYFPPLFLFPLFKYSHTSLATLPIKIG